MLYFAGIQRDIHCGCGVQLRIICSRWRLSGVVHAAHPARLAGVHGAPQTRGPVHGLKSAVGRGRVAAAGRGDSCAVCGGFGADCLGGE